MKRVAIALCVVALSVACIATLSVEAYCYKNKDTVAVRDHYEVRYGASLWQPMTAQEECVHEVHRRVLAWLSNPPTQYRNLGIGIAGVVVFYGLIVIVGSIPARKQQRRLKTIKGGIQGSRNDKVL